MFGAALFNYDKGEPKAEAISHLRQCDNFQHIQMGRFLQEGFLLELREAHSAWSTFHLD